VNSVKANRTKDLAPIAPGYFDLLKVYQKGPDPLRLAYIEDMDHYTELRAEQEQFCKLNPATRLAS
jgi:hypothetical protein